MDELVIDIETIPGQDAAVLAGLKADAQAEKAACKAPGNYKDQAKIAEHIAAQHAEIDTAVDEKWRKTALDGAFGQIAVASFAVNNAEPVTCWNADWKNPEAEEAVLHSLNDALSEQLRANTLATVKVIGHNVAAFDLRFLVQRCIVRGIRPHMAILRAAQAKPWEGEKVFDTMVQWAGVGNRIKLDKLCRALGLPGKGDIDGSMVWDYVQAGRIAEVAAYCADDVRKARAVYRRMTFADLTQPVQQFEDVAA